MEVSFVASVKYKNQIFFSMMKANALAVYDLESGKSRYLGRLEEEKTSPCIHWTAFLDDGFAWFLPYDGRNIARVNLNSLKIEYISIESNDIGKYEHYVRYDDSLYIIPNGITSRKIIEVDLNNKTAKECSEDITGEDCFIGGFVNDDRLYIASATGDIVAIYDLKKHQLKKTERHEKSRDYIGVINAGGKIIYLPGDSSNILIENLGNKKRVEIPLSDSKDEYYRSIEFENKVILIPYRDSRNILIISNINDSLDKIRIEKLKETIHDGAGWLSSGLIPSDEGIWISTSFGEVIRLDEEGNIQKKYTITISDNEKDNLLNDYLKNDYSMTFAKGICKEENVLGGFKTFLGTI